MTGELHRHGPGELQQTRLRCGVRAETARDPERQDRQHVDDRAGPPGLDHAPRGLLRDPPRPFQVGADDRGPVLPGDVEGRGRPRDAGVVHEDVGRPERLLHRVERVSDTARVGHVHPHRVRGAAGLPDLAREGLQPFDPPGREGDRGAVRGEGAGEVPAETARRSGHERGATVEMEGKSSCHGGSGQSAVEAASRGTARGARGLTGARISLDPIAPLPEHRLRRSQARPNGPGRTLAEGRCGKYRDPFGAASAHESR